MSNLYIVATPIGNLEDITLRALRILKEVDLVLAEDTRQTKKLLEHYDIKTRIERFDAKIEAKNSERILKLLEEGKSIALVSDAGTPGISDPGAILVKKLKSFLVDKLGDKELINFSTNKLINLTPVPGPSSLSVALSVSGINNSKFLFLGFLPHKKGRDTIFKNTAESEIPVVFFESPHRLIKTLTSLKEHLGENKKIQVFRELTKIYEEVIEGRPKEVLDYFEGNQDKIRGEIVIIVS